MLTRYLPLVHASSLIRSSYSAADSRPGGSSPSAADSATLNSQPAPYGSELIRPRLSSTSGLTSVTAPSTGQHRSLTDLVASTSPHGSPPVPLVPRARTDTY